MRIAIASGKGGAGKTTVTASLASVWDRPFIAVDTDVEAPNLHLFLPPAEMCIRDRSLFDLYDFLSSNGSIRLEDRKSYRSNRDSPNTVTSDSTLVDKVAGAPSRISARVMSTVARGREMRKVSESHATRCV